MSLIPSPFGVITLAMVVNEAESMFLQLTFNESRISQPSLTILSQSNPESVTTVVLEVSPVDHRKLPSIESRLKVNRSPLHSSTFPPRSKGIDLINLELS